MVVWRPVNTHIQIIPAWAFSEAHLSNRLPGPADIHLEMGEPSKWFAPFLFPESKKGPTHPHVLAGGPVLDHPGSACGHDCLGIHVHQPLLRWFPLVPNQNSLPCWFPNPRSPPGSSMRCGIGRWPSSSSGRSGIDCLHAESNGSVSSPRLGPPKMESRKETVAISRKWVPYFETDPCVCVCVCVCFVCLCVCA